MEVRLEKIEGKVVVTAEMVVSAVFPNSVKIPLGRFRYQSQLKDIADNIYQDSVVKRSKNFCKLLALFAGLVKTLKAVKTPKNPCEFAYSGGFHQHLESLYCMEVEIFGWADIEK